MQSSKGKVAFHKLFSFADRFDVLLMIVGTLCSFLNGASSTLALLVFGMFINSFATAQRSDIIPEVSKAALMMAYLAIGSGIASFLQGSCWILTGERQSQRIRSLYIEALLRQDIGFFDTDVKTGDLIERISGDTALIRDSMAEKVGQCIQLLSKSLAGFVIAFIVGWRLAIVTLICVPFLATMNQIVTIIVRKAAIRRHIASAEAGNVAEQTIGAIRTVASFTGEAYAIGEYNDKLKAAYKATVRLGFALGLGIGVGTTLVVGSYGLAIWYGSKLIIQKGYNGGQVMAVILVVLNGGMSLGQVTSFMGSFVQGQIAAYKLFQTIKRKSKIDPFDTCGMVLEDIKGEIELKDVYFAYPSRPDVQIFSGFSLLIPNAKTLALVGPSGNGKSTVINLIERFYDPDSGQVLIDGVDLKMLKLSWIRQKIGLVSQEPTLFTGSIKENLKYANENASDEDIRKAIQLANASDFIKKMPEGLDTLVGEHGTQLSGGQKQRIAIARAILKDPKIILLDEPTSALDSKAEHAIQDTLLKVMSNKTSVVVAHRLTTIRSADTIAVLDKGKIVEKGTHEELMKNLEGEYFKLVQGQGKAGESVERKTDSDEDKLVSTSSPACKSLEILHDNQESKEQKELSSKIRKKPKQVPILRLAYMSKPELPTLLIGSFGAAISGVFFPLLGFLMAKVINMYYKPLKEHKTDMSFWVLIFLGNGIIQLVASLMEYYFFGKAGGKLIERISSRSFEKVVYQDCSWFDTPANSSGAIGARLSTNASEIRGLVDKAWATIVKVSAAIIVGLCIGFAANWILTLVLLCASPLLVLQGYLQHIFMLGFTRHTKAMYEDATQMANEAIGGIRTIASFCAEKMVMDLFQKRCAFPNRQTVRQGLVKGSGFGLSFFLLYGVEAFCLYIGAILVHSGKATFEAVFMVYFAITITITGIVEGNASTLNASKANNSIVSMLEILDMKPKIDASSDEGTVLAHVDGKIEFQHVSFNYPMRSNIQILKGLSLTIPAGKVRSLTYILDGYPNFETESVMWLDTELTNADEYNVDAVHITIDGSYIDPCQQLRNFARFMKILIAIYKVAALVGESGCGKSTIISLIQRFYDPNSGCVYLDGINLSKIQLKWLRQQMGLVGQEPVLFNETIRANIAYGRLGVVNEEQIITAAKAANAHDFICSLPEGYDTQVGQRGGQLSGGQKQRIAIARAILHNPRILLLDEATSALDTESEHAVQDALQRVMINKTTVVVSHRLTSIKHADKIVVLQNGVVVEEGSHDVLMNIPNGAYASLVCTIHK